jgi:hypothetical protein
VDSVVPDTVDVAIGIRKHLYAAELSDYVRSTHCRDIPHVISSTKALRPGAYKFRTYRFKKIS